MCGGTKAPDLLTELTGDLATSFGVGGMRNAGELYPCLGAEGEREPSFWPQLPGAGGWGG